jgi:hypothetical protein
MAEEPQEQSRPNRREVSRQEFVDRHDESNDYAERRRGLDSMPVPPPHPVAASALTGTGSPDGGSSGQTDSGGDAGEAPANGAPADYDG